MDTLSSRAARQFWDRLFVEFYDEFRTIAARHMARERPGHTLRATALVHELYLHFSKRDPLPFRNAPHARAIMARAMRRFLIEHARRKPRAWCRTDITLERIPGTTGPVSLDELLTIDEVLEALGTLCPNGERFLRQVECRWFADMKVEEVADALGVTERTIRRDWVFIQAFLRERLSA